MRIGSRLGGVDLIAHQNLMRSFSYLAQSSMRLSTMQQINRGSDDPAGLIAVGDLQAELEALEAASNNASRAVGTIRVADSAMNEVGNLINSIRGHVIEAAGGGLSDAEIAAKQMEVDAALEAIDRIGSYTSFGGRKLLDGGQVTFVFSPDVSNTLTLSLPNISTSALGGSAGRLSDLRSGSSASLTSGNPAGAADILDTAQSEVLGARARTGAFEKYTIESSQRVMDTMEVSLSSALSQIFDTDVAKEASQLVRSQILVDAGISALMIAGRSRGAIGGLLSFL